MTVPEPIRYENGHAVRECGGCGREIALENHTVRGGEAFCADCEPLAVGRGLPDPDFEPAQTIAEYEARKNVEIDVAELLDIEPKGTKRDEVGRVSRAKGEPGEIGGKQA